MEPTLDVIFDSPHACCSLAGPTGGGGGAGGDSSICSSISPPPPSDIMSDVSTPRQLVPAEHARRLSADSSGTLGG